MTTYSIYHVSQDYTSGETMNYLTQVDAKNPREALKKAGYTQSGTYQVVPSSYEHDIRL